MKVLVTGSTGFIGSQVLKLLVRQGHDVSAIVRPYSDRTRIGSLLADVELLEFDLDNLDREALKISDTNYELCIHLAWYAEPGLYLHASENIASLSATLNLAARLARAGCQRFIGIGSCFEYDLEAGYLSETSTLNPDSLYAACKTAAAVGLDQIGNESGMQTTWVRLFYQYGPFEDQRRLVPAVLNSMISGELTKTTSGEQLRDFLHVEDVASAICAVADSDLESVVNIGSGRPVRVRDIVEKIGEITGRNDLIQFGALPYRESDPMFVCANNRRLVENTDWKPKYDLESGLRHTAEWLAQQN